MVRAPHFIKLINSLKSQSPTEGKDGGRYTHSPGYCMRLLYSHQRSPVYVLHLDGLAMQPQCQHVKDASVALLQPFLGQKRESF